MKDTKESETMNDKTNTPNLTEKQKSALDKAIARAKETAAAKAEAKAPVTEGTDKPAKVKKDKKAPKAKEGTKEVVKKAKPDPKALAEAKLAKDAERKAAKAARDAERETKKAAMAAEREAKKAEKAASKAPAHLGKVDKAGAKLPTLDDAGKEAYELVTGANLTEGQMATLVAHLAHFNRRRATIRSLSAKLEVGQRVTIVSSDRDPRLIGRTGTITQVRKIRVLVDIGGKRDAYLFTADVAPIVEAKGDILTCAPAATTDSNEPQFLTPEAEEPSTEATGTEGK